MTAKKAPLHFDSIVLVIFYLINIDEILKYLLTQREKGGWYSSLMDGPGAQAAPHTTTAVQSRKSTESQRKCASTGKTYTPLVATSVQSCAEIRGLWAFRGALQPFGSCSQACRGGTWLEPAQFSSATRAEHVCCVCTPRWGYNTSLTHPNQGMWHQFLLSQQMGSPEGKSTRT